MEVRMIMPVLKASMLPDNYLPQKERRRRRGPARKTEEPRPPRAEAALYEPTDPDKALREFYMLYGR